MVVEIATQLREPTGAPMSSIPHPTAEICPEDLDVLVPGGPDEDPSSDGPHIDHQASTTLQIAS
jgi:hypothetical protein